MFKTEDGQQTRVVVRSDADVMYGDVDVRVGYSRLNDKEVLAMTGRPPVGRTWPPTPGIDVRRRRGTVHSPQFRAGDRVVLNGWGVGEIAITDLHIG